LYAKEDLTKSINILRFNPKKYIRLNLIKHKYKQLVLKKCLYSLFKNNKNLDNSKISYRKLK